MHGFAIWLLVGVVALGGCGDPGRVTTLTVTRSGNAVGEVRSSPPGISCGERCTVTMFEGSEVTLVATPNDHGVFGGWIGDGCAGRGDCELVLAGGRMTIEAAFVIVPRTLTIARAGTGTGTVVSIPAGIDCGDRCEATYEDGTHVTLTAVSSPDSVFAGWTGGCEGTGPCIVDLTTDVLVTATFIDARVLAVARAGTGLGVVTSTPTGIDCGGDCTARYPTGASVALIATPAAHSTFTGWSGGGCHGTGTCVVVLDTGVSITATFTLDRYELSVIKAGTGAGTVVSTPAGIDCGSDCHEVFDANTTVVLAAQPAPSATFQGWSGACSGMGPCTVTLAAVSTVTATFTLAHRTLTVTKAGTGTGTVRSSITTCGVTCPGFSEIYVQGAVVTLTASPAPGATFVGWSGACVGVGTCTVVMAGDVAVTPTFATCTPPPAGIVSWWTGDGTAADRVGPNHGTEVGVVTYAPGMVGAAFALNGDGFISTPSVGFPMGAADRTVEFWAVADSFGSYPTLGEMFFSYGVLGTPGALYSLFLYGTPDVAFSQWGDGFAGGSMDLKTWTHLAVTTTNGGTTIYVDGLPVVSGSLALATAPGPMYLGGVGAAPDGSTERLTGMLDEVTVYDRALTALEIKRIAFAGASGKCKN